MIRASYLAKKRNWQERQKTDNFLIQAHGCRGRCMRLQSSREAMVAGAAAMAAATATAKSARESNSFSAEVRHPLMHCLVLDRCACISWPRISQSVSWRKNRIPNLIEGSPPQNERVRKWPITALLQVPQYPIFKCAQIIRC